MSSISSISAPSQTLTQNDFLKLLVTQMTAQDPLNPQSSTDFAAQMAQFTALQNSTATETDMAGLQANSLIGRTVIVTGTDGNPVSGVVDGVQMQASGPKLVVNGQAFALSALTGILPTATTTTTTTTASN